MSHEGMWAFIFRHNSSCSCFLWFDTLIYTHVYTEGKNGPSVPPAQAFSVEIDFVHPRIFIKSPHRLCAPGMDFHSSPHTHTHTHTHTFALSPHVGTISKLLYTMCSFASTDFQIVWALTDSVLHRNIFHNFFSHLNWFSLQYWKSKKSEIWRFNLV